jgi:hypothetical protein
VNETGLKKYIAGKLPKAVHYQSMTYASLSRNGTPDHYYDGAGSDLWVEYKMLRAMPRSGIAVGDYSAQQLDWMERRYANAKQNDPLHMPNVVGIVGLPNRTAVIQRSPTEWRKGSPITEALPLKEIAQWITAFCLPSSVVSAASS